MKRIAVVVGFIGIAIAGFMASGSSAVVAQLVTNDDKITICHASGQEGTLKFETLTLAPEAVFGQAGHFFENGTPRAGHEQDYMGPCQGDTTSTSTTTTTETEPTDVCPNIPGNQESVPPGFALIDGLCQPIDINPQCAPPLVFNPATGLCEGGSNPPPPPFKCPNGEEPIHGQDGNPGNDSCNPCDAPVNLQTCPPPPTNVTSTESTPTTTTDTTTTTESGTTETTPQSPPPVVNQPKPNNPQGGKKHHNKPKPHKPNNANKMPPLCPVGVTAANSPQEPCAVQGSG